MEPKELSQILDNHLRTETFPVGMRSVSDEGALPPKVKVPSRDMGHRVAICQGLSMARKYGWSVAMGREDVSCPLAKAIFGLEDPIEFYTEGNLAQGMYAKDLEAGKRMEEALERFAVGEYDYLVAGPLNRLKFEPDTVLVYGNPAQVLRLINAVLFEEGGSLAAEFSGRGDCADIVVRTKKRDRPQVIMPCMGDRVFGLTADHEMAFTFPFTMAEQVARGLESTHKAGIRYPIPQYLRYEAKFPPTYQELERMWEER